MYGDRNINYIGRKKELQELEQFYNSDRFEFGYIFGRRRIEKSTLMEMFLKGKNLYLFLLLIAKTLLIEKHSPMILMNKQI